MTRITIPASRRGLTKNRFVHIAHEVDTGEPYLNESEGPTPLFATTSDVEESEDVIVNITGTPVWDVEAGEEIQQGDALYSGEDGKAFARESNESNPARLAGYALNSVDQGEIVKVYRQNVVDGNWINEVSDLLEEPTE